MKTYNNEELKIIKENLNEIEQLELYVQMYNSTYETLKTNLTIYGVNKMIEMAPEFKESIKSKLDVDTFQQEFDYIWYDLNVRQYHYLIKAKQNMCTSH